MRKTQGKTGLISVQVLCALTLLWIVAGTSCAKAPAVDVPADAVVRLSDQFSSDFSLIDHNGKPVTDEDFRGKPLVVYFGFASCPDVCPLALGTLSAALNELSASEQKRLQALFISVDPERDTPEALKSYLAFDERITGLTGSPAQAEAARRSFKVFARKEAITGSALGYTMNHSDLFYLVDGEGRPQLALHTTLTAQQLAEMLRRTISR
jgi:protein SCO1/2